jgi:hypothetical protein
MHHRRHANPKLNFENPLIAYRYTHALSTQHDKRAKPVNPSAVYLQYNIVPNSHRPRSQHITTLNNNDIHDHDPFAKTFFPKERFSAKQAKQAPMHYSELGLTSWRPFLELHTLKLLCSQLGSAARKQQSNANTRTPQVSPPPAPIEQQNTPTAALHNNNNNHDQHHQHLGRRLTRLLLIWYLCSR